jgi:transcriptional regulator with XRE-family HTH domain
MENPRQYETLLAKWLQQVREEKGLSQEALGVQLGKGQSDVAKIESGSKRVSVIEFTAWMVALNIPFERAQEPLRAIFTGMSNKN